ncbi:hypothetical protein CKAH01_19007 [Colletotrichum kahawae]|uniref:Uncharacterized protein n=1 Tax=Colletotrichum kahawae TaxID=34407 RepID=A0AAE0D1V7_COLKA|nr:hypothetical protein CKAH01_19007 [Colletotrichum kahawae]
MNAILFQHTSCTSRDGPLRCVPYL